MFYERLAELRKQRGLSQEELGEKVNVTRQTVSKWELGLTTPELDKLIELAKFFNCTVDYLVGKEEAPTPENKPQERAVLTVRPAYEYKSKTTLWGLPLVHIHLGFGLCRAKGIIAIGNIATGVVAIGGLSVGAISLGGFALGLLAIGGGAIGLLLALGGFALGLLALGGICVGVFSVGGIAVGVYSIGGVALASDIAAGGVANGHIAIGAAPHGEILFNLEESAVSSVEIREAILKEYPKLWKLIADIFALFGY